MNRTTQVQLRAALALSGWIALAVTLLPGGAFLRWAPVLLFVTFGPGLAILHPRPRPRSECGEPPSGTRLETLALAAPLSWSLATLAATALFLVQGFSATVFLVSLAAFCTVVALLPGLPLPTGMRGAAEPPVAGAVRTPVPGTDPAPRAATAVPQPGTGITRAGTGITRAGTGIPQAGAAEAETGAAEAETGAGGEP